MKKVELLAPAGDLERLKTAIIYGADAVYLGGQIFSMRAAAKNFSMNDLKEGIDFAHKHGVRVFLTANIIPHNDDLDGFPEYLRQVSELGIDAIIVSDPGTFNIVKETIPDMEIHISTQANNTNYHTVNFWYKLGAKRIVLARELSFKEIKEIKENVPEDMDLEAFVHAAMCMSYSGRCLLSNYMIERDANRGECAHPCRWKYYLVEEKRPREYMPIIEDEHGTYIMNSKDLCMIEYIPEIIESGINSLKIEGRMKTTHYVATVVRAYRMAIDSYYENPEEWKVEPTWMDEIRKASYREFTTGFYIKKPDNNEQIYENQSYDRKYDFIGIVRDYNKNTQIVTVEQRNRFFVGDKIEIFGPDKETFNTVIEQMWDEEGNEIEVAPHPQQIVKFKIAEEVKPYYLVRKEQI